MNRNLTYLLSIIVLLTVVAVFLYTPSISLEELQSKYTTKESQFIEINGLKTHYRIEGNGPPLLLIHGTASSLHTWDGWVNELKSDFTTIRLDIPAFGLTGPNNTGDYTIDFYTDFIDSFLNAISADTLHIAGNSLGGGIAWSYALKHPNKVKKLVLVDASGYPKEDIPFVFKIAQNPIGASLLKVITPRSFVSKNIHEVYYDDEKVTDNLVNRYYELTLRAGNRQAFIDRAERTLQYDHTKIQEIEIPTLIMWGKYDEWIPVEDAYKFQKDIINSQLILYESGHVPMEENATQTATDTKKFLLGN